MGVRDASVPLTMSAAVKGLAGEAVAVVVAGDFALAGTVSEAADAVVGAVS